ncbi:alpha/beta fold hydrolase [Streptomyces sp. TRM68367]|uniref:alpha/beta fold hydrolase n=1 Tax=Streptomyces sp. TRM68367 TaxID=2758415 RepID=UPI00165B283C|nr:alpha/beta hydrolase [Streptomyces sp. TRM68367]MBC9730948.1 alpha/beta hydrolase [Streptomyces sp. TRM68367]
MTTAPGREGLLTAPDGTRIAYRDHTPPGPRATLAPPLLLLHGLAGHQGEWDALIPLFLADGHRVVTYDARGHGASTLRPADTTRAAHVRDAVALVDELSLAPVTLIGQSLGGHTAMLLAAAHPDLAGALILVEAGAGGPNPGLPAEIAAWLDSWPTPFASLAQARAFLGHEAWTRTLENRRDGWYPAFDRTTIVDSVAELATTTYWPQWSRTTCPTLLVRGEHGTVPDADATRMLALRPDTHHTLVPHAAHDVHLDQPALLHEAIADFLASPDP